MDDVTRRNRLKREAASRLVYVASYSLGYRIGFTALSVAAACIVLGAAVYDESPGAEPLFTIAAVLFGVMASGFMLELWTNRVRFGDDGITIASFWKTTRLSYSDLSYVARNADKLELRFRDGKKAKVNRHMGNLTIVAALITQRSNVSIINDA